MRPEATTRLRDGESIRRMIVMIFVYLAAIAVATTVSAQSKPKAATDPKLKPRPVTLKTRDGIHLRAFFFPSDKGKEAIPVLLVHEWQGQASPYAKLVVALRDAGCAVLIPDYRGHGGSREYTDSAGRKKEFNLATMSKKDVENIIAFDMEEAKQFLKKENDDGNLNLNALVVIGVREGCVMAGHWAMRDWHFPSVGRMKQGQDVKALVMISPESLIKGVNIELALRDASITALPIMIVAGEGSPEAEEADRLAKRIESVKRRIGRGETQGFEFKMVDAKLSGPALVNESAAVIPAVASFIKANVKISDEENPWIERN